MSPGETPHTSTESPAIPRPVAVALILLVAFGIQFLLPRPAGVTVPGWRMLSIFLATVLALMLRPLPGGAAVLIGITLTIATGVMTLPEALSAYGGSTVWLVLSAFFVARALINSGLSRRIALMFIRKMGGTSLGLGYALLGADFVLAGIVPSNAARVGGTILPIARSMAEIYKSLPGPTAGLLGSYLMLALYQGDVIACATFLTGQAGNPLAARLAEKTTGIPVYWSSWLFASVAPAVAALAIANWVIPRSLSPPEVRRTPEAPAAAARELDAMGPMNRNERIVLLVFVFVGALWITTPFHKLDMTLAPLLGVCLLLATGALSWRDAMAERVGWDVFVWYGGLVRMGEALNDFGLTRVFAAWVAGHFPGWQWPALMVVIVLIYFYAHYAFASLTTHFISMYGPFLAVLVGAGAPAPLTVYILLFFTNLSASLTHYGTTPAPIVFSAGYVTHGSWWRVGLLVSFLNLAVWTSIGLVWWKVIGLW